MARCAGIDLDGVDAVWNFCPSFAASVLFTVLFFILTGMHIIQAFTFRKTFCWVIIMGTAWETAGFAFRAASGRMPDQLGLFIAHRNFVILAPLWLNAFVYMVLARMIHVYVPEKTCFGITARRLATIFVSCDILAFIVQAAATAFMVQDDLHTAKIGVNVYMGGVGLQQLFIMVVSWIAFTFHRRMRELETRSNPQFASWQPLMRVQYASLICITIRNIYRLVEFSQGTDSAIADAEAAFYVTEAVPMVIATLLFNVIHPGRVLVGPDSEFPKKKKEKKNKRSRRSSNSVEIDSREQS